MTDLGPALKRVVEVLGSAGVPHMVIGGVANLVWGQVRTTTDLDLTVDIEAIGIDRFLAIVEQVGEHVPDDPTEVAERGRLVVVRTPGGIRVDFALAALPFEVEAIRRATPMTVLDVSVPVCAPEDLIVMKSVAERTRDHDDVVGILRRQGERLDLDRLDATIGELAGDLAAPEIAERWRAAKAAAGLPPG
jgi:hypothetical protein